MRTLYPQTYYFRNFNNLLKPMLFQRISRHIFNSQSMSGCEALSLALGNLPSADNCPIPFRERCRFNSPAYFSAIIFWWSICRGDSQHVIPSAQVWILTTEPCEPCPKMRIWEVYPPGDYLSYREIWPEIGQDYRKHIFAWASALSWISVSLATYPMYHFENTE